MKHIPFTKRVLFAMTVLPVGVSQLTAQVPLPAGVQLHRDVPYVSSGHERQKLDVYLPAAGERPLPVIVWIYGGAWRSGSKETNPLLPFVLSFLTDGFAVVSINYRLSQHALFPAQIEDARAAIRWIRANAGTYGFDSNRIGVWGNSSGGHLAALLGTMDDPDSTSVRAVVDFFGPTDFLQMDAHRLPDGLIHDAAESPESRLIGGPIQENREKVERANPIIYVTSDDPPFLIVHGDRDLLVPHHQSVLLYDALRKAGVASTFRTIEGAGHGGKEFTTPQVQQWVLDFFTRHLKTRR